MLNLTESEWMLIKLKSQGLTSREIGEVLDRSPKTIKNRLFTIYKKLEVNNSIQMLRKLYTEHGIDVWNLE